MNRLAVGRKDTRKTPTTVPKSSVPSGVRQASGSPYGLASKKDISPSPYAVIGQNVGLARAAGKPSIPPATPAKEEEEFVPEEEEEGPLTQGDHLMLRKARHQPTDVEEEEFVPEEEEEGPTTQGDHLMLRKARRQPSVEPTA